MWTPQQTARALRDGKPAILRGWKTDAIAGLRHLDSALFATEGALIRCATDVLAAIVASHESGEPPIRLASLLASPHAAYSAETAAAHNGASVEGADSQSMVVGLESCANDWASLSLNWADTRVAIEMLATHAQRALRAAGAEPADCEPVAEALDILIGAIADRRVALLEREIATDREEAVMTQHLAGRFLANASHELRTPLTAVLGFAELLLEDTYGALAEGQRTAVGHIEESAQNLLEIVNNLLDLLHIRAGKLKPQYRPVEFTPLLRNLYTILIPLSKRKNVQFQMDIPEDLGIVEADENIVRHIVYHLLASALRSTPTGGRVILSAERGEETVTVLTHDTALHLPPEAIANMLGPFPLLENSPARGYEGWEVGLPLVRRYIDLHGGKLETESLPEQGTTFRIIFPITAASDSKSSDS